jgi:flagellar basal-body rod protein FlgB
MTSSIPALFDLLTQKMSYLNQRQGVLAENVANADTPNYKQLELKPFTFGDAMKQASIGIAVTDPRHIVPASLAGMNAQTVKSKDTDISPSGNTVDIENQMMEVSKTAVDYQKATSMYHKWIGMLKIAVKGTAS